MGEEQKNLTGWVNRADHRDTMDKRTNELTKAARDGILQAHTFRA